MTRYYLGVPVELKYWFVPPEGGWVAARWPDGKQWIHWSTQLETTPWGK